METVNIVKPTKKERELEKKFKALETKASVGEDKTEYEAECSKEVGKRIPLNEQIKILRECVTLALYPENFTEEQKAKVLAELNAFNEQATQAVSSVKAKGE